MMEVLKCKCGNKVLFTEGDNYDCMGCEDCMTTFALPGEHKLLQPHKWAIVFDDGLGEIYTRCTVCGIEDKIRI
jgi:hypothetical protein